MAVETTRIRTGIDGRGREAAENEDHRRGTGIKIDSARKGAGVATRRLHGGIWFERTERKCARACMGVESKSDDQGRREARGASRRCERTYRIRRTSTPRGRWLYLNRFHLSPGPRRGACEGREQQQLARLAPKATREWKGLLASPSRESASPARPRQLGGAWSKQKERLSRDGHPSCRQRAE
jgi:hypothetical protein